MSRAKGFTLLELIVSVGIFSVIILIVMSAYLRLVYLDRQARAMSDLMTNLSFVVESMSREIRTGQDYKCNTTGTNCAVTPGTTFRFTDSRATPRTITYSLATDAEGKGQVRVTINGVTSTLTDPRVDVNKLDFYVQGVGTAGPDYRQPQVTFVLQGTVSPDGGEPVDFSIQSSGTQRYLELI